MENSKRSIYKEHYNVVRSFYKDEALLKLTVKEVMRRYEELFKEKKSLQTFYRWIDILKSEGILIETGFKITPHSQSKQGRKTETLYCPVAEVFFFKDVPLRERWFNQEKDIKKFSIDLQGIVNTILEKDTELDSDLFKIIQKYESDKVKVVQNIVVSANDNPTIIKIYQEMTESEIAHINREAAILIALSKNKELLRFLTKLGS